MLIKDPPVQLTDHLWMLGIARYPVYLLKGADEGAIIEGGIGAVGPLLAEQLKELDLGDDFIRQVIVTHAHPDHVMAVPLWKEMFPQATVAASAVAAQTLSVEKAVSFFCKMDDALTAALSQAGLIAEQHRRPPLAEMKIAVDRTLQEGDIVTVDGTDLNVLATPGHSACSLSFHDPGAGVLLISDATGYYMPEHDCWWPNYFTNYAAYLDSMRRLAELNAEILCLSHNAVIKGDAEVKSYFSRAMATTEAYHTRILDETKAGKSVREIAEQLGTEIYEKTPVFELDFFQKNCGLLVKLSLKHERIGEQA